jgi:hypothetical protein
MACDPDTVLNDARCWLPLSWLQVNAALVQQLCVAAGDGCDPDDLMDEAKCWRDLSSRERWASFVWLLCQWTGNIECDPDTILDDADARCWLLQSGHARRVALVQSFCNFNGGCVIQDVLTSAKCLLELSQIQLEAIMVWLMCQIAGSPACDPDTILASAKCWLDLSDGEIESAAVILACSGGGPVVHCDFNDDFNNDFCNT